MSFLNHRAPTAPAYTGLQLQTSCNALPIAIVWGAVRIAPNIIETGNFHSFPQSVGSVGHSSGGKGGISSGNAFSGSFDYTSGFYLAICEGQINGVGGVWDNQSTPSFTAPQAFNGAANTGLGAIGFGIQTGGPTQGPLSPVLNNPALSYRGTAYANNFSFDLGGSPSLPALSFEVFAASKFNSPVAGAIDGDPALIIQDFLSNPQYGVLGDLTIDLPTLLGSSGDSSYQTYCKAVGLAMSPALVNAEQGSSILARWLQITNTAAVWSGGQLKFIPYGDAEVAGQFATYIPNVTPVYNLTDDDFIAEQGADPVQIQRTDPFNAKNWLSLEFLDRAGNAYAPVPVDVFDQASIDLFGTQKASMVTAHEFCVSSCAQISAQLILQRMLYIRNTYSFKLSYEYCLLEPMDLVTLTDVDIGLNNTVVRITSIEEDDQGLLSVTAEEFPQGAATAVEYPVQLSSGASTVFNAAAIPSQVNTPIIFEPPFQLTNGAAAVWVAISGGVAPVFKLEENSTTTTNFAAALITPPQPKGTLVTFSVNIKPAERTAGFLQLLDVVQTVANLEFDLVAGTINTLGTATVDANIINQGNGWFTITASLVIQAEGDQELVIFLSNTPGNVTYEGVPGSGFFFWGAAYSAGNEPLAFLPAFAPNSPAAAIIEEAIATPSGAIGGTADPNWGGANIFLSTDNNTYSQVGRITGASRMGVLSVGFGIGAQNPDPVNQMPVSLLESGGALQSGTDADAESGVTLCIVDDEMFAYATATLTGPNAYELGFLQRGLFGTTVASHNLGAPFARLDNAIFEFPLPTAMIGKTIFMKFQSFNVFGNSVQDLSTCAVFEFTPSGKGFTPPSIARELIGAAASGPNSDISSINGLTTPLSIDQGGHGSTTAAGALANLGAAEAGENSNITSINGLTTPLSIDQGGHGATTAAGARSNLGSAASGNNQDITNLGVPNSVTTSAIAPNSITTIASANGIQNITINMSLKGGLPFFIIGTYAGGNAAQLTSGSPQPGTLTLEIDGAVVQQVDIALCGSSSINTIFNATTAQFTLLSSKAGTHSVNINVVGPDGEPLNTGVVSLIAIEYAR
ncbi:MAG: phage tail protein [Methylocella sp.]